MPKFVSQNEWAGQPAFLIGGGASLKGFDFSLLKGQHTIGINHAFRLGKEIIEICFFGDATFLHHAIREMNSFGGRVVTCAPTLQAFQVNWLEKVNREDQGLHREALGWNLNSGAAAINLAILLGATTIYLLGFDCQLNDSRSHWHDKAKVITEEASFQRFMRGFANVKSDLYKFPDVKIFNVSDGTSRLDIFPMISFAELPLKRDEQLCL